ncbi:HTH-type transcriptional regulator CueR [subsurface metagenome]
MGTKGITEKYQRIGELAKEAGVTVRTIRYYEELGLLEAPKRKNSEHRRYTKKDLVYLLRIKQLKEYGLTLGEIAEIISLAKDDPSGEKPRQKLLFRYRDKLQEALEKKDKLNSYISELRWHIDQLEEVGHFQACPGEECRYCKYRDLCQFAVENRSNE